VIDFPPQAHGRSQRLTAAGKPALPPGLWPEVRRRVEAGESLRSLARAFGVSHETIRRTIRREDMPRNGADGREGWPVTNMEAGDMRNG
jgi:DNA invertase Pin-like site-specific DNA recombinase